MGNSVHNGGQMIKSESKRERERESESERERERDFIISNPLAGIILFPCTTQSRGQKLLTAVYRKLKYLPCK